MTSPTLAKPLKNRVMIELLIYSAYALAVVFGVVAVAYVCSVFGCIAYAFVDTFASLYKSACRAFKKVRAL